MICKRLLVPILGGVTLTIIASSPSDADLSSADYARAKTLYNSNQLREAAAALVVYEAGDKDWLASHPEIKEKIDAVIKWCNSPEITAIGGVQVTGPPRPQLP
jgi:hypothetical protein